MRDRKERRPDPHMGLRAGVILSILLLLMEAALRIEKWQAWRWEKQIRREEGGGK